MGGAFSGRATTGTVNVAKEPEVAKEAEVNTSLQSPPKPTNWGLRKAQQSAMIDNDAFNAAQLTPPGSDGTHKRSAIFSTEDVVQRLRKSAAQARELFSKSPERPTAAKQTQYLPQGQTAIDKRKRWRKTRVRQASDADADAAAAAAAAAAATDATDTAAEGAHVELHFT